MDIWLTMATSAFIDNFGAMVAGLATVGVFTKAIIDLVKTNGGWRKRWQKEKIAAWIANKAAAARPPDKGAFDAAKALEQLTLLAAAGDEDALYAQKSEKLVGLINAAIQMAMDDLEKYKDLVLAFGCMAPADDIDLVEKGRPEQPPPGDADALAKYKVDLDRFVQARKRVATYIQRSLDGLLISMDDQWGRLLQSRATLGSIVVILAGGLIGLANGAMSPNQIPTLFVVAVFGGMIAPGINDFAKTLTGLGKKL